MCKIIEFKGKATFSNQIVNSLAGNLHLANDLQTTSHIEALVNMIEQLTNVSEQINEYANFLIDSNGENNSIFPGSILFSIAEKQERLIKQLTILVENLEVN